MKVDILIPCYERTELLDRCIESLEKYTRNIRIEVVEGKRSLAENRNICMDRAKSEWFVILDDDVEVTDGWLDKLLEITEKRNIALIQPKVVLMDGRIFSAGFSFKAPHRNIGYNEEDKGQYDYIAEREFVTGTCLLYNSVVKKYAKYDENFRGTQYEEIDFEMQLKKFGFKFLYNGFSVVKHHNLLREAIPENLEYLYKKWFKKEYYKLKVKKVFKKFYSKLYYIYKKGKK